MSNTSSQDYLSGPRYRISLGLALCLLLTVPISTQAGDLVFGGDAGLDGAIDITVEESIDDKLEDTLNELVFGSTEDPFELTIEDSIEDGLQDIIEEELEETVEEDIADTVDEGIEEALDEVIEESVADVVEEEIEQDLIDDIEESVEDSIEAAVEESVAEVVEEALEESVAGNLEDSLQQNVENDLESGVESRVAAAVDDRLENTIEDILDNVESGLEVDEDRIRKDQWLVMAEPEVFDQLAREGYLFETVSELPAMGLRLAEVAAPSSFDIGEIRQGVIDIVGRDRAEVDMNHFYSAGAPESTGNANVGMSPRAAVPFPTDIDQLSLSIGMIDSQVDTNHPALDDARIQTRSFAPKNAEMPDFHGTAIASMFAGNSDDYQGLAPNAKVYAAEVFEKDARKGDIASTVSLVRALDWLISSGVDVINISLAGPSNRLLEAALDRAVQHNVMILAAAGNGGPSAQPMYPAAYSSVVAITAVDGGGRVFRLANRGDYLDLAAPGVDLLHAKSGGGYATSSGTSFAVPFAAAAAARLRVLKPEENVLDLLHIYAEDLGAPGHDEVYGYGLLRPSSSS